METQNLSLEIILSPSEVGIPKLDTQIGNERVFYNLGCVLTVVYIHNHIFRHLLSVSSKCPCHRFYRNNLYRISVSCCIHVLCPYPYLCFLDSFRNCFMSSSIIASNQLTCYRIHTIARYCAQDSRNSSSILCIGCYLSNILHVHCR